VTFSRSLWGSGLSFVRRHGQAAAFWTGAVLAGGASVAWYYGWIGQIRGSLLVGIGSSAIAAALVAYLGPFSEAAYRRFISLGIDRAWPSREAVNKRDWVDWLGTATYKCVLLGIAHGEWCRDPRFPPALRDCLERGVRVKILFLNPNSGPAQLRAREEQKKRITTDAIRKSIGFVWDFREDLTAGVRDRLSVYVYDATPSCGLTWIDDFMIVTHYLAGLPNRTSPALRVSPPHIGMESSLYSIYAENLQNIESASDEVNEKNIKQLTMPSHPVHASDSSQPAQEATENN
jgi:hypothetical protein